MSRRFFNEQILRKKREFGRHRCPRSDRGGLKPAHADWVLLDSTDATLQTPTALATEISGSSFSSDADQGYAKYGWQTANGAVPADHAFINHSMQVSGNIAAGIQMNGNLKGPAVATATATINGTTDRKNQYYQYWGAPWEWGIRDSSPMPLPGSDTKTSRHYFSNPSSVTTIESTFPNEAAVAMSYYIIGNPDTGFTMLYTGSGTASSSASAQTSGFTITD